MTGLDPAALLAEATDLTKALLLAGLALALGWALHAAIHALLMRAAKASSVNFDEVLVQCLRAQTRCAILIATFAIAATSYAPLLPVWRWIEPLAVPALIGWTAIGAVRAVSLVLEARARAADDEFALRSHRTRIALISRTVIVLIGLLTLALVLMSIREVREIGVTLVASAGLATLAVGAAAQPALKSLIAGIQMALTEPIRIDDYVVIDGEGGRVEDIRMTFVVIRTGDNRRLVVPTSKFLETSFQNWTLIEDALVGTVTLPLAPDAAIPKVRAAFLDLIAQQADWDGKQASADAADLRPGVIELRLSMGARNPAALARLRTAMREAMLEWIAREMPEAIIREH